jgi:curved DNA-binding protein CbpA
MIAWFRNRNKGCPKQSDTRGSAYLETRGDKRAQIAQRLNRALSSWCVQSTWLDESADPSQPDRARETGEPAQLWPEPEAEAGPSIDEDRPEPDNSAHGNDDPDSGPQEPFIASGPRTSTDYYEVLQISRKADSETVRRVFRMMAVRFHPDNPVTGDADRFLLLKRAYTVLSDPTLRAQYDAGRQSEDSAPLPIFDLPDFVDEVDGEMNRRLGVLSLLYRHHQRRTCESESGLSVLDLENRMAFPREHLNFTLWYLASKGYIVREDNSDFAITVQGVDFVENSRSNRLLRKLLTDGSEDSARDSAPRRAGPVEIRFERRATSRASRRGRARHAA